MTAVQLGFTVYFSTSSSQQIRPKWGGCFNRRSPRRSRIIWPMQSFFARVGVMEAGRGVRGWRGLSNNGNLTDVRWRFKLQGRDTFVERKTDRSSQYWVLSRVKTAHGAKRESFTSFTAQKRTTAGKSLLCFLFIAPKQWFQDADKELFVTSSTCNKAISSYWMSEP